MADCVDPKLMELIARNVVFKLINEHTLQSGLRSCDSTCTWLSHESRVATCDQLDAAIAGVDIGDTIEGFTYDPDTGLLTIDTDQGNFYVTLPIPEANTDTYPVSLVLGADYVLSLTLNNGTILTTSFQPLADMVQAFTDRFLRMVGYNASTHTMTFEIGSDSGSGVQTFTINLSDLIPITVAADVCLDGDGTEASPLSLDIDCLVQRIVELAPSMALHLGDGCGLTGSGTAADPLCIDPDVIARRDALGTAAYLDVPASGDAGPTEVVLGSDSRLGGGGGGGNVVGPASAVTGNVAVFTDSTGTQIADGGSLGTAAFADIADFAPAAKQAQVMLSNMTTALTTGTGKALWIAPEAGSLTDVWIGVGTVSSSGAVTVDLNKNGTSVLTTRPSIDASENTSLTGTAAVIGTAAFVKGDRFTFDIDAAGTDAKALMATVEYEPS